MADYRKRTASLCAGLPSDNEAIVNKICYVIDAMNAIQLDLLLFLDLLSWGNQSCMKDAVIWDACTSLMHYPDLPDIIRCWWKPPRYPHCPAQAGIETFAFDLT